MNNVEFFIVGQGLAGTFLDFEMLQNNMETLNITHKKIPASTPGNYFFILLTVSYTHLTLPTNREV